MKICTFLGEELTDEAIDRVVKTSTFKNMKMNPKANYKDLVETTIYSTSTMRKGWFPPRVTTYETILDFKPLHLDTNTLDPVIL